MCRINGARRRAFRCLADRETFPAGHRAARRSARGEPIAAPFAAAINDDIWSGGAPASLHQGHMPAAGRDGDARGGLALDRARCGGQARQLSAAAFVSGGLLGHHRSPRVRRLARRVRGSAQPQHHSARRSVPRRRAAGFLPRPELPGNAASRDAVESGKGHRLLARREVAGGWSLARRCLHELGPDRRGGAGETDHGCGHGERPRRRLGPALPATLVPGNVRSLHRPHSIQGLVRGSHHRDEPDCGARLFHPCLEGSPEPRAGPAMRSGCPDGRIAGHGRRRDVPDRLHGCAWALQCDRPPLQGDRRLVPVSWSGHRQPVRGPGTQPARPCSGRPGDVDPGRRQRCRRGRRARYAVVRPSVLVEGDVQQPGDADPSGRQAQTPRGSRGCLEAGRDRNLPLRISHPQSR